MPTEGSVGRDQPGLSYWPPDLSRPLLDWTLGDALRSAASVVAGRVALIEGDPDSSRERRWTYAELQQQAELTAASLLRHFEPGDRVAVWAANVPEWQLLLYGCALAGVVMVTVNPAYKARELEYVLAKSGASGLFLMDSYRGYDAWLALKEVRPRLPALRKVFRIGEFGDFLAGGSRDVQLPTVACSDPCVIMFTSGTTGTQKGVMFHHKGLVNMSLFTQERGGLAEGGVFVNPMPMFHVGALGHAAIGSVMRRATHVLAREWDPLLYMSLVHREGGTYSMLVPTMIESLLAHPERKRYRLSTLRNLTSGAAVVEADLIRRTLAELGCTICNVYGQTEMQGVVTAVARNDSLEDQALTIGRPLPHVEVRISDPDSGGLVPFGTQGEICVRGYQIMIGYFNMPDETSTAILPDGWLRSGDLGSMDARGYLRITGRIKDMIIRGGENIYPREIEQLLLEHPKVAAVAVIGIPDVYWGEVVGAVVVPKSLSQPPSPQELHDYCRLHLASYKGPRLWYLVDSFPHTETGKLQKFKLVAAISDGRISLAAKT